MVVKLDNLKDALELEIKEIFIKVLSSYRVVYGIWANATYSGVSNVYKKKFGYKSDTKVYQVAWYHQEGRGVPKRDFLTIHSSLQSELQNVIKVNSKLLFVNPERFYGILGLSIKNGIKEQLLTTQWAALSSAYKKRKDSIGATKTLYSSGRMYNSIDFKVEKV